MKKSPVDVLVTEWAYRCKKGYPDINNKEDKKVLEKIMKEWKLEEAIVKQVTPNDVETLTTALAKVKDQYAKYLAVFYYFDPNSLGTISEVLLAKLLSGQEGITAKHTGGSQKVHDITVNGKLISIKTTASDRHIRLGSNTVGVGLEDNKKVVEALKKVDENLLRSTTVKDLKEKLEDITVYKTILQRLEAIAEKIAGNSQDELFLWVEKKYTGKLLSEINIHLLNYDKDEVLKQFMNGYLYVTGQGKGSAWGLKDSKGNPLIQGDLTGKPLNITPVFIRETSSERVISTQLGTLEKLNKIDLHTTVSDKMLIALDQIYSEIHT